MKIFWTCFIVSSRTCWNHRKVLKSRLPRNPDLHREVQILSQKVDLDWVARATQGLDNLESRLRRNVGRQLGLDALVASLAVR